MIITQRVFICCTSTKTEGRQKKLELKLFKSAQHILAIIMTVIGLEDWNQIMIGNTHYHRWLVQKPFDKIKCDTVDKRLLR